jgi:hypothetical protein
MLIKLGLPLLTLWQKFIKVTVKTRKLNRSLHRKIGGNAPTPESLAKAAEPPLRLPRHHLTPKSPTQFPQPSLHFTTSNPDETSKHAFPCDGSGADLLCVNFKMRQTWNPGLNVSARFVQAFHFGLLPESRCFAETVII